MNVVAFPSQAALYQTIGHFIRLGDSGYKKNAELHAQNLLRAKRFVVNGSRIGFQRENIRMLREGGAEVVLDPRTIELGSAKYCGGDAAKAPWTLADGSVLTQDLRVPGHIFDLYGRVARCAVDHQVDTVLGPSSLVTGDDFKTAFNIDRAACLAMRSALRREWRKGNRSRLPSGRPSHRSDRRETTAGTDGRAFGPTLRKPVAANCNLGRYGRTSDGTTAHQSALGDPQHRAADHSGLYWRSNRRGPDLDEHRVGRSSWDRRARIIQCERVGIKAPRKLDEDEERKGGRAARVDVSCLRAQLHDP